jgi:hypothetical protein
MATDKQAARSFVASCGPIDLDGVELELCNVDHNVSLLLMDVVMLSALQQHAQRGDMARIFASTPQQLLCQHSEVKTTKESRSNGRFDMRHKCKGCGLVLRASWEPLEPGGVVGSTTRTATDGTASSRQVARAPAVCTVFTTGATVWLIGVGGGARGEVRQRRCVSLSRASPPFLPPQMEVARLGCAGGGASPSSPPVSDTTGSGAVTSGTPMACWPGATSGCSGASSLELFGLVPSTESDGDRIVDKNQRSFIGVLCSDAVASDDVAATLRPLYAPSGMSQRHAFETTLGSCDAAGLSAARLRSLLCHDDSLLGAAPALDRRIMMESAGDAAAAVFGPWSLANDVRCLVAWLRGLEEHRHVAYSAQRTEIDGFVKRALGAVHRSDTGGDTVPVTETATGSASKPKHRLVSIPGESSLFSSQAGPTVARRLWVLTLAVLRGAQAYSHSTELSVGESLIASRAGDGVVMVMTMMVRHQTPSVSVVVQLAEHATREREASW